MSVWGGIRGTIRTATATVSMTAVLVAGTTVAVAEPLPTPQTTVTSTDAATQETPTPDTSTPETSPPSLTTDNPSPATTAPSPATTDAEPQSSTPTTDAPSDPLQTPAATTATTPPPPEPPADERSVALSLGVTSSRVATLMQALDINVSRDYYRGSEADVYMNLFTTATLIALRAWQTDNGYPATGAITTQSEQWRVLMAQRGPARVAAPGTLLRQGSTSTAVNTLQSVLHLNVAGPYSRAFTTGIYNSYFGPQLHTALTNWQRANGHEVTGTVQVGSLQWQALLESQHITPVATRTPLSLRQGMTDPNVWTLQARLDRNSVRDFQPYATNVFDTYFGPGTAAGLRSAQSRLGYRADGVIEVGTMEWNHLRLLATVLRPGKVGATLGSGTVSTAVPVLQRYLDRNRVKDYFGGAFSTSMTSATVSGLKAWQSANGYPVDGVITVNSIEWGHLFSQVRTLDPRCATSGVVLCASKGDRKVYYVNKGQIVRTLDARFGGRAYDVNGRERIYSTAEGTFYVTRKIRDEVSYTYGNTPMPFSLYFYGGQAFHYSDSFARDGWVGDWGSHGCINLRSWSGAEWLYNNTRVGTKVVVYR